MIKLTATFHATPKQLYDAWLSGKGHSAMTGAPAKGSNTVGGTFTAWGGYIFGKNTELVPHKKIMQTWRTTEFPDDAPDSLLTVTFKQTKQGTALTLLHTNIPRGQEAQYRKGWKEFYFEPISDFFVQK